MMKFKEYCRHYYCIRCNLVSIQQHIEEFTPYVNKVVDEMKSLGLQDERVEELVKRMFDTIHQKECKIDDIMEDIAIDCDGKVALEAL